MLSVPMTLSRLGGQVHRQFVAARLKSAWIKATSTRSDSAASSNVDVEELFIDPRVQALLTKLTGLDVEGKIFTERLVDHAERSHFALMTDSMLENARAAMRERATRLLQFVPVKEPREETFSILAKDPQLEGFDSCKYVFTDITFDATNQDRTVVIREPDGTLRTALPEEHDRMNRVYYEQPNRPPVAPAVFKDPALKDALDADRHEFVLDFACWFYEPDDPEFVRLSHIVFDRTVAAGKFDILYSTRHFGAFAFYLVLNDNIPPLLNHYGSTGRLSDAANLIRLQKIVYPNWRTVIGFSDTDKKIVRDFLSQNKRLRDKLPALVDLLDQSSGVKPKAAKYQPDGSMNKATEASRLAKARATVNRENLRTTEGPLGELSEEYPVKFARDDKQNTTERPAGRRPTQKTSTYKERLAEIDNEKNKKD
uniref:28S ribosomal protein S22, mitochondrial n=1 Tax=Panagrellus redivivus TaxID=6233 RepID=A0A7E4WAL9_PANRE